METLPVYASPPLLESRVFPVYFEHFIPWSQFLSRLFWCYGPNNITTAIFYVEENVLRMIVSLRCTSSWTSGLQSLFYFGTIEILRRTHIKHESLKSQSAQVHYKIWLPSIRGLSLFNSVVFLCRFSCYLGRVSRPTTEKYLQGRRPGTYLIRDSSSIPGDFVLAVR